MSKTIILTNEQIKRTLNVQFVNCESFSNTFYKYMPLSRVLEMLENRKITFVYPELWNDPYEVKYLNTDFSKYGYHQNKLFCLCVRNDNLNQEASWKVYRNLQEPLIKLSINAVKLMQCINSFSKRNNTKVYFSKIDYSLKSDQINNLYRRNNIFYEKYIENMDELKYIKLMSLKRNAFSYENERRIFIVGDKNEFKDDLLKININLDMITRFTINPCERIKNDNIESRIKLATYDTTNKVIVAAIKTFCPKAKIYRSLLYSTPNNEQVAKIE